MTELGLYLQKRSINKSIVSKKTGINKNRLYILSNNQKSYLRVNELYLIALAIEVAPCDLLEELCVGLELKNK